MTIAPVAAIRAAAEAPGAEVSQAKVETSGPSGNFGAVLFIEKEGFAPLLKAAQIAKKYDIAIMSTKGMSVVAARVLADEMCSDHDIPFCCCTISTRPASRSPER
jgi:DNA topoisomerase VI subunit A